MTRVTQETTSNVVCVLETLEDICGDRKLTSLSELGSLSFSGRVDVLNPAVMLSGRCLGDVLLKYNDIGVWDFYRVCRGKERSNTFMDSFGAECWC